MLFKLTKYILYRRFCTVPAECSNTSYMCGATSLSSPLSSSHTQSIHPYLNQVVKVVLPSDPAVVGLQTVGLVGDILCVQTFTVVELAFEQLERQRETEKSVRQLGCHSNIISITPELTAS